jgi:hypothetical protein
MGLTLARRIFARLPGLKWALAALLQRVPALDRRLRSALVALGTRPSPLRIDAAHLPEDAVPVQRALMEALDRRRRR